MSETPPLLLLRAAFDAVPIHCLDEMQLAGFLAAASTQHRAWVAAQRFRAEPGRVLLLPGLQGGLDAVLTGFAVNGGSSGSPQSAVIWAAAALSDRLPPLNYSLAPTWSLEARGAFALGWLLGRYRFGRYRKPGNDVEPPRLLAPDGVDADRIDRTAAALGLARDLINTPAGDLGPAELVAAVRVVAAAHAAMVTEWREDGALRETFPLVHAVGRASSRAPRVVELRWGDPRAPRVTLVGKGVCFDTGGLDLKPSAGMLLMKKDMGGAAVALATAQLLMAENAPIQLRLLIPAVENSVSGDAFRPGDVLRSRKGLTVEIGNTDAEGRLILADALCAADEERPDLLLDFATLTGAARVALGPELPAVFSPDPALLRQLCDLGLSEGDPVWPLPLWAGYDEELNSRVADLNNVASSGYAGAIFGALFLKRFVAATTAWAHFDLFAWNPRERPGRPVGAEAQCVRLAYQLIRQRFG